MIKNKVIIWSEDNYNALGHFYQLGPAGLDLFFLINGNSKGMATRSKYCKVYHETNSLEEGLEYLLSFCKNDELKPIVMSGGDLVAEAIDQHRNELLPYFIIQGTKEQGLLTKIDSKNEMSHIANELSFLVPMSIDCYWNSGIDDVKYPCILKPSKYTVGHKKEFKTKVCNTAEELNNSLSKLRHDSLYQIQEYIPKETDIVINGCRMMDGSFVFPGTVYKNRTDGGDSSFGKIVPEIDRAVDIEKVQTYVEKIDYYGLFAFEFGLYQGKAYFYEVNLRNDATTVFLEQVGANLLLAWALDCAGKDYAQAGLKVQKSEFFMDEIFDYINVLTDRITKRQWKKDKEKATVFKYYHEGDEGPWKSLEKKKCYLCFRKKMITQYRPLIVKMIDKLGLNPTSLR